MCVRACIYIINECLFVGLWVRGLRFSVRLRSFKLASGTEGLGKYSCKCAAIEWTLAVLLFGNRQPEAAFKLGVWAPD